MADSIYRFLKRYYKTLLLVDTLIILCYAHLVLCGNIRIDTEVLINNPGYSMGWDSFGRYGLVFLKHILGLSTHHTVKSGILFLIFFTLQANVLLFSIFYFSGEDEKYPYWMFGALYCTAVTWYIQAYFSLQQAEIACAMLMVAVAAFLAVKAAFLDQRYLGGFLAAWVLLQSGFSTYQAFVAFYIAICISLFLVHIWKIWNCCGAYDEKQNQKTVLGIVRLIVHFLISYGMYYLIMNRWFNTSGYVNNQSAWGKEPILDCFMSIIKAIVKVVIMWGPQNFSFYTAGACMLLIIAVIVWKDGVLHHQFRTILFSLTLLGLMITPFLLNIYTGSMGVSRAQFALPVVAAFMAAFSVCALKQLKPMWKKTLRGITALVVFFICGQIALCVNMALTDDIRNEYDLRKAELVVEELLDVCDDCYPEKPVAFVGKQEADLPCWCLRAEMYGMSFFEWDYSPEHPMEAGFRIRGLIQAHTGIRLNGNLTELQSQKAEELAEGMTDFPEEGSVLALDDMIIVRLSEIEKAD